MISSQLEQVVEAFERAQRQDRTPEIGPFVADLPEELRAEIVVELVRSDIEYRWENGLATRDLDTYRREFPDVFDSAEHLRGIAFEDCRQRLRRGQPVDSNQYARQFGIDVADWQLEPPQPQAEAPQGLAPNNAYVQAIYDWFGDFVPLLELGRGAAGRVYLASQGDLAKRLVALKVTREPNLEPLQLAQLQHSNIVPIYSVHRHGDWQAVCMPFVGHFTLSDLVKHSSSSRDRSQSGRDLLSTVAERTEETIRRQVAEDEGLTNCAPPNSHASPLGRGEFRFVPNLSYADTCVWIGSRVAAGLGHAHRRGIVHSDLKPSNIVIGHDGEPMILDFHLAHRSRGGLPAFVGGTLPYMSAEHLESLDRGVPPTETCDVFSLGVILYQMLTGRLPYPDRKGPLDEILPQLKSDRLSAVAPPSSLDPVISPDVDAIVLKCLAPNLDHRYATAAELEEDLRRHLQFFPPKFARSPSTRERLRKWIVRHPGVRSVGFISATALLVITAIATWVAYRTERDARNLAISRFANVSRELNDVSASLASAGFGGASLTEANEKALAQLESHEIVGGAPPSWERYLSPERKNQLSEQLAEVQYLIAANHLQNLRGLTGEERERELAVARKYFDAASAHFTSPPAVLHWQADLLRTSGEADSRPEWQRFAEWHRQNAEESYTFAGWLDQRLLAIEQYRQGDFLRAITLLEAGLRTHPNDYPSWLILGNAYAKAKNFSKAEMCYLVCQTLQPTLVDSYFNRGVTRIDAGAYREAIADFNWCIELDDSAPEYFANRGLCHYNLRDLSNAEADLSKAIELGARATRLYFFREQVRRAMGNGAGADADQAEGLQRTPSDELSWISRGFHFVESDPAKAIADFQSALELNPRSAIAWENSAAVYADKLNQLDEAIECMDALVEIEPQVAKYRASRGSLHARADHRDLALADAQAALKLSDSGESLYRAGAVFARLAERKPDDGEQAMLLIRGAAAKDPLFVLRYLDKDPDLKPILDRPDFKELADRLVGLKNIPKPR